jgi:hypothetical protein
MITSFDDALSRGWTVDCTGPRPRTSGSSGGGQFRGDRKGVSLLISRYTRPRGVIGKHISTTLHTQATASPESNEDGFALQCASIGSHDTSRVIGTVHG